MKLASSESVLANSLTVLPKALACTQDSLWRINEDEPDTTLDARQNAWPTVTYAMTDLTQHLISNCNGS